MYLENPREYILERIEQIRDARAVQHQFPRLFDESNITSLYRTLDATNRGYITNEQYYEGNKRSNGVIISFIRQPIPVLSFIRK